LALVSSLSEFNVVRSIGHGEAGTVEVYLTILEQTEPGRRLYLAVPSVVYESLLTERFGQLIVTKLGLRLIVFDDEQKRVIQWIE
jgi:hypothetical protein